MGSRWHCLSGKILPSWNKWQPGFPQCRLCAAPPLPTRLHLVCSHRPALLRGLCTLVVQGSRPSFSWGFHLAENLIFRLELSPVPGTPGTEQRAVPTSYQNLLCTASGRCQASTHQQAVGPKQLLSGGRPGRPLVQGFPVSSIEGLCASSLPLPSICLPPLRWGVGKNQCFNQILQKRFHSLYNYHPL